MFSKLDRLTYLIFYLLVMFMWMLDSGYLDLSDSVVLLDSLSSGIYWAVTTIVVGRLLKGPDLLTKSQG